MSKHTPGPWEYIAKLSGSENHRGYFVRAQKQTRDGKWALAEVQPGDEDGILGEANARLIAATPDLLAVLKELEECAGYWSEYDVPLGIVERIRSVIKKAGGAIPSSDIDAYAEVSEWLSDWQPIATAPKDASVILYCKRFGVVCGRWSDERYATKPRPYWKHDKTHLYGINQTREDQPTHWMPLPEAPK